MEIQIWVTKRFQRILKSLENSSRDQAMAQSFKNPFGDYQRT